MSDQWRPYDPPGSGGTPPPPPPPPPTHLPYGSATYAAYDASTERRRLRSRIGLLVVGVIVVLGGAGAGIAALVANALDDDDSTTTTTTTTTTRTEVHSNGTVIGPGGVDLFSTAGTKSMAEAVIEETGSPRVLEVVLLQVNAVITVPGDDGPRTFVWDGSSMTAGGPGVSARKPFDVRELDGAVVGRLCGDEPLACTAIIGRPLPSDNGAWITIAGLDGVHFTDLRGNQP